MQFLHEGQTAAVRAIAARIAEELTTGKRVLWLVGGGGNASREVEVMALVRKRAEAQLGGLAILPTDERYGSPGHPDSTIQRLRRAGLEPGNATLVDVLMHNLPFDQTLSFYTDVTATAFANAGVIIGQFGLGNDGRIAGVVPDGPAAAADEVTVAGYQWQDHAQLTLTPAALAQMQVAYVLAYGQAKKRVLERLQANTDTLTSLPAKSLYQIPEVYVYNDQLENQQNKE